ncbi:MAG: hypothetical protein WCF08_04140 [Anaerolineaceae bacterium]
MRTPAGTECTFFFGDYYRGRNRESCRLIGDAPPPRQWTRDLCKNCPVPGILRANSCEFMSLIGKVSPGVLHLNRHVIVQAYCRQSDKVVDEPYVGCGICHPLPIDLD